MYRIFGVFFCFIYLFSCTNKENNANKSKPEVKASPQFSKSHIILQSDTIKTLIIENKEWLAENVSIQTKESWCYENITTDCSENGRLYRWQDANNVCKELGEGWKIPKNEDWMALANQFGGYYDYETSKVFGQAKNANKTLGLDGQSGFNAKRNGWRGSNGGYSDQGEVGFYWSGSEISEDEAHFFIFYRSGGKLTRRNMKKRMGMSVRCVREKS